MSIITKIKKEYQNGGLPGLFSAIITRLQRNIFKFLITSVVGIINRDELIAMSRRAGQYWEVRSSETMTIKPPAEAPTPTEFEPFVGEYQTPPIFVCELSGAKLLGPKGTCYLPPGGIVLENIGHPKYLRFLGIRSTLAHFIGLSNCESIHDGTVAHLINYRGLGYGPWLNHELPKIMAIRYYAKQTGKDPILLIDPEAPDWVFEHLKLLGYSEDDWIIWDKKCAKIDQLVLPSLHRRHSTTRGHSEIEPVPALRDWMYDQFHVEDIDESYSSYIFVSRQNIDQRKVKNFEELQTRLVSLGFDIIEPENLSIKEQIRVFSQAELIVGVWGSGLSNMVFGDELSVIILYPENGITTDFYLLANECGHNYDHVVCLSTGEGHKNDDIIVDVSELEQRIFTHSSDINTNE